MQVMKNVIVIGMGLSVNDLTSAHLEIIRSADLLMGGRRHLAQFKDLSVKTQAITGDIDAVLATIQSLGDDRRVVVLASGDPLLFGIGARLVRALGDDAVTVLPNVSTIAAAFARLNMPWDDARIVSLHGRDRKFQLLDCLKSDSPVAVLTDREQTPQWLAGWLLARGCGDHRMAVFEQLGSAEERFGWYSLEAAAGGSFTQPNVVIINRMPGETKPSASLYFGMSDVAYAHEQGLITKSEIRAVTLAKLNLRPGLTLWDLGAGSGSVGLEASVLLGWGRVVAVEQKPERVAQIRENARRYRIWNLEAVQASLPDGLGELPEPDRIFIGGGGRDLAAIIGFAIQRLDADGIIVVNTVLLDSLDTAMAVMEKAGMAVDVVQVQVNRGKTMPKSRRFEAENPVWIVRGRRKV